MATKIKDLDPREVPKVQSLPDDLKSEAEKLIAAKFNIKSVKGEVVEKEEKPKAKEKYSGDFEKFDPSVQHMERHTFIGERSGRPYQVAISTEYGIDPREVYYRVSREVQQLERMYGERMIPEREYHEIRKRAMMEREMMQRMSAPPDIKFW